MPGACAPGGTEPVRHEGEPQCCRAVGAHVGVGGAKHEDVQRGRVLVWVEGRDREGSAARSRVAAFFTGCHQEPVARSSFRTQDMP